MGAPLGGEHQAAERDPLAARVDDVDPLAARVVKKGLAASQAPPEKSIKCPGDVEAKVGTKFDCTAYFAGGRTVTFTIRVDKVNGNNGHMTIVGAKQH
jgi:hypothetical protein